MQAWTLHRHHTDPARALRLDEVAEPIPGPGQLRLRVQAIGLNPVDRKTLAGETKMLLPMRTPFVPGVDAVGTVEAVGAGVTGWEPGQAALVYTALDRMGAWSERIVVEAWRVGHLPAGSDLDQAAALPLPALCAWQSLRGCGIGPGSRVLVHGAAGAVGSMAVQLAAALGATAIATASGKDREAVLALGAQQVIDYRSERFDSVLRDLDAVIDTVGGDTLKRSFAVLRPGGSLATLHVPPPASTIAAAGLKAALPIRLLLPLLTGGHYRRAAHARVRLVPQLTTASGAQLEEILALTAKRPLRSVIAATHAFADLPAAVAASATARGRVIVRIP